MQLSGSHPPQGLAFLRDSSLKWRVGYGRIKTSMSRPEGPFFWLQKFFSNNEPSYLLFENWITLNAQDFSIRGASPRAWLEAEPEPPDYERFSRWLSEAQAQFKTSGDLSDETSLTLQKVVPWVCLRKDISLGESWPLFLHCLQQMLQAPAGFYPYGLWCDEMAIVGSTPEFLFSFGEKGAQSMALAGTVPVQDGREKLLLSAKDAEEHGWVVEDLTIKLSELGPFQSEPRRVVQYGRLYHLRTDFFGEFAGGVTFEKAVEVLHPTAALGGYPWCQARNLLVKWDQELPRGYLGAPFGFQLNKEEGFCVVVIRGLWREQSTWLLNVGCGVIEASCLEKESRELALKIESTEFNLGLRLL